MLRCWWNMEKQVDVCQMFSSKAWSILLPNKRMNHGPPMWVMKWVKTHFLCCPARKQPFLKSNGCYTVNDTQKAADYFYIATLYQNHVNHSSHFVCTQHTTACSLHHIKILGELPFFHASRQWRVSCWKRKHPYKTHLKAVYISMK